MRPNSQWVIPQARARLVVGVADMVASNDVGVEIITYSLGSCLAVTVFDPAKKIGGLLHLMLPDSKIDPVKAIDAPFMFVDTGVPRLFHAAYNFGAERSRLVVKVAGGAQLLDHQGLFNIGARNFDALKNLLTKNGLDIHSTDVGGLSSRTVSLDLSNGTVTVNTPGSAPYSI